MATAMGSCPVEAQTGDGIVSIERLHLAVSLADSEGGAALPAPRGPHHVGTVTYHWILDEPEELTPAPSDRREVIAQLFHPARAEAGPPAAYVPELPLLRRGLLVHGFPPFAGLSERLAAYARVRTAARAGAPVLEAGSPHPVVLVSPGGNMSRHWHTALAQELASRGYAVAVLSHAHSGMDVFPGGGFLASHPLWHPGEDVPEVEAAARDRRLARRLASDARAVLDGLGRLNGSGTFHGSFDLERVGLVGHSRGGSTVTMACGHDVRFGACVILDNVGAVAGVAPRILQPRLVIRAPWPEARAGRLSRILAGSDAGAFEVVIPGAVHDAFTDLVLVDPVGHPSPDLRPEEAHRLVSGLTAAFFDRYLLGRGPEFTATVEGLGGELELTAY